MLQTGRESAWNSSNMANTPCSIKTILLHLLRSKKAAGSTASSKIPSVSSRVLSQGQAHPHPLSFPRLQCPPPANTLLLQFLLSSPEERKKTDDEYVQLYSKYRVDVLARLILTVVAVVLLMVPTAVLFLVQEHGILKIMLIMIFTMLFSAALSVFTKAKRHEMFAATAA